VSSDSDYIVRLYRPGEEEEIVEVLKISFPEWGDAKFPLDYWKWKYLDCPLGSHVVVADWDGKIVGVECHLLLKILIDEKISLSSYSDDSAVHPDYRRKGISKNMLQYALDLSTRAMHFAIQTHEATVKNAKRQGMVLFPFSISHMLHVRDVDKHFRMKQTENNLVVRFGFSVLKLLNRIKNLPRQTKTKSNLKILEISKFDERINKFWEKIRDDYNFIIEKNREYLNWRYCDPRNNLKGRYFVKQAEQDGEILGFIVLETRSKDGYSEGYIVDLLTCPGRMDVARKLVEETCSFFWESEFNAVHYRVVKDHPYQVIFSEQGFIEIPSKLHMTYKMFYDKEKMQVIKDSKPSQIHFNYGDYY
jgi:GNAT superfamily N-acetyltransferase